jgi:hypothetical protein
MIYKDYWIGIDGDLVHDPTLKPPAKYRYIWKLEHVGFEATNSPCAYSDLDDRTDEYFFKVMVF